MASPSVKLILLMPGIGRDAPRSAVQWSADHALQPWQSQFCKELAQTQWSGRHLPVAELLMTSRRDGDHETGGKMQGPLICADPVHLRADRDTARLVTADMLSLSAVDADALLCSINEFLRDDDLRLYRSDACHWFMQGLDGRELLTYPPGFLARRNASAFLPEGEGSERWKTLMTELQMLLHAHPVNARREQQGLMPVNSLWFWGGAPLARTPGTASGAEQAPQLHSPRTTQTMPRIHADEAFAVALAEHLGLDCRPLDEFDPARVDADVIIVDRRLEQAMLAMDESGVDAARRRFVEDWVAIWQERMQQGEDIVLEILDEDGMQGRLDKRLLRTMAQAEAATARGQVPRMVRALRRLGAQVATLWQRPGGPR